MRFSSILLAIALIEMVAAGVYYGAGTEHGDRLEIAANNFNDAQLRQNEGDPLPDGALERLEAEFDAAAADATRNDKLAFTFGVGAVLTAIAGGVAILIARRRERAARPDAAAS
ncbi:MAG: hypothetical protein H6713_02465 [Myxococcales bacterium]|nr:hypothetical protein [Myxococcales bacterium]MCB9748851.1 hypothetical protein [Myxococcales bacterium]